MKQYKRKFEEAPLTDKQDVLVDFMQKYVDGYGSTGIKNSKQYLKVMTDILLYIKNDLNGVLTEDPEEIFDWDNLPSSTEIQQFKKLYNSIKL